MKNYLKLFLILVSFIFILNVAQAEIPENINQAHKAVWEIKNSVNRGTAFFIASNQVVTNFHVISEFFINVGKYRSLGDFSLQQGEKRIKLRKILYASALYDLVILETKEKVSEYLSMSEEYPSGSLFVLGYPQGVRQTLIHSGKYGISENKYSYTLAVNHIDEDGGLSGSPVLDEKKEVIGIFNASINNILEVIKVSKLEELRKGEIGLDCSNLPWRDCIEQEIQNLTEKAEEGDPQAQLVLGIMYIFEIGVDKNEEKAFDWMEKAATEGNAIAQCLLALMYLVLDHNEEIAAKEGYSLFQYLLTLIMYLDFDKNNKEKAFYWMEKAAIQGYAPAQYELALMYLEGKGVDKNEKKFFQWMLKAAVQGHALAQDSLSKRL